MQESGFIIKARANILVLSAVLFIIAGLPETVFARSPAAKLTDPAELEAFMDGVVEAQLEAYHWMLEVTGKWDTDQTLHHLVGF